MTLLTEDQRKKLSASGIRTPHVNETCIGCSACTAIAWEVFELDDEWKSVVIECSSYNEEDVDNSISACPVDAISWKA
jgi:ferredoxin